MLGIFVRIIQKIESTPTFGLCLSTLKLCFPPPQTSTPSRPLPGAIFFYKCIYFFKDVYGKYLSFATLGSYVACLGAKVFKFLWRVIFGGFLAEDEQRPKLVSAHPQTPLWLEKSVLMWNSTFGQNNFSLCNSDIPNRVRGQRQTYNCHSNFQKNSWLYSTSSPI